MSLTKTPLSMVEARGEPESKVKFDGKLLKLGKDAAFDDYGIIGGSFDDATGTLNLILVNGQHVSISGFLSRNNLNALQGENGLRGQDGVDGKDGKDGEKGATGCEGPTGPRGPEGRTGATGKTGEQGAKGVQGEKGEKGNDGIIEVYIQNADPGPQAAAGAIWVKTLDD